MPIIHPLALVDSSAELDTDVEVGPFCLIEAGVKIGRGTKIESHAVVKTGTTIGEDCHIWHSAILGAEPQDRKFAGEVSYLQVGNRNMIREFVTLHRARGEGEKTLVGDDNYLMAYVHQGHNGNIGNFVTIANSVSLAGSVTIEDLVTVGGASAIHQFVRVGKASMIGGFTRVTRDVPPYMLSEGEKQEVRDINAVGLRRMGITPATRMALHKACKLLFKSRLGLTNAIATVQREIEITPEVQYLIDFEMRRFGGKNGRGDQP